MHIKLNKSFYFLSGDNEYDAVTIVGCFSVPVKVQAFQVGKSFFEMAKAFLKWQQLL